MKRLASQLLAALTLGVALMIAVPAVASATCNTANGVQGSIFYVDSACGGSNFTITGNGSDSTFTSTFNDKVSSILVGKNQGVGTVSNACLWFNSFFNGTEENWVNGSSTVAKYINLTSDPMQDNASSAATQWGTGSPISTCSQ